MNINPMLWADGYKCEHFRQYPEGTTTIYSNMTARSAKHAKMSSIWDGKTVFFGLQGFVKEFLIETFKRDFFDKPREEAVAEFRAEIDAYLGPDAGIPAERIGALHDLGYLPLRICALPEGERVPIKVPYLTIENTLPEFFWLTNFVETVMSCELWHPITAATIAADFRAVMDKYADLTGTPQEFVKFQGHDFSMRGLSCRYSAQRVGAAHLLSFVGTDSVPSLPYVRKFYGAGQDGKLVGCSVPASEHSVMSAGGHDDELSTFKRMISEVYPAGIVSIVSDTWDFFRVVTEYAELLKPEILGRAGKTVFRPDTGNPADILCGIEYKTYASLDAAEDGELQSMWDEASNACEGSYNMGEDCYDRICKVGDKFYKITGVFNYGRHDKQYYYVDRHDVSETEEITLTPEQKGAVECLWDIYGGSLTAQGYKMLDKSVGVIFGDSITIRIAEEIFSRLAAKGFASGNVVLGVGSYSYQYVSRDTFGMAVKSTYAVVNGEERMLSKDPKTGDGMKKSATGRLVVTKPQGGEYELIDGLDADGEELLGWSDCLQCVFVNGKLLREDTLSGIRERLHGDKF